MKKLALAALAAGLLALPAMAQDKPVDLKLSIWIPPQHPLVPSSKAWADDITKQSGGSIKITIFPSEQLGKEFDHYDMARDGIADITYVKPGHHAMEKHGHRQRRHSRNHLQQYPLPFQWVSHHRRRPDPVPVGERQAG